MLDVNPAALIAGGRGPRRGRSGCRCGRPRGGPAATPEAVAARRATRSPARPTAASPASTSTSRSRARARDRARWTCCCARCAGATARSRSSSPRAGTITDRKRVEQRLARQNAELSALTERLARVHDYRERLLGELSHDLRAPLQVVITRVRAGAARRARRRTLRAQLVNIRLAALERARADQRHARAGQGRPRRGAAHARRRRPRAGRAHGRGAVRAARRRPRDRARRSRRPTRVAARFDVERVSRIVSNLLANAIRHAPVGGRVRCALDRAATAPRRSTVADSGPGVPPEHRDRVFGRFRSGLDGDGRSARRRRRPRPGDRARVRRAARRRDLARRRAGGRRAVHGHAAAAPARTASASPRRSPSTPPPRSAPSSCARSSRPSSTGDAADAAGADGRDRRARARPRRRDPRAASATPRSRASPRTRWRRCGWPSSCGPTRSSSARDTGDMPPTSLLRRLAADERLVGVRRVALAGEREEDHSPEALITAGAQLVLPAAARRGARRPPVGGRHRRLSAERYSTVTVLARLRG